jgi:serine/threonine protein kinase
MWCKDESLSMKLNDFKERRKKLLEQLFSVSEFNEINLELFGSFSELFLLNPCILFSKLYFIQTCSTGSIYLTLGKYILKQHENISLPTSLFIQKISYDDALGQRNPAFDTNKVMVNNYICTLQVRTDNFINQVLIQSILDILNVPQVCTLHDCFYTITSESNYLYTKQKNDGYLVLDYANQKDLSDYLNSIIVTEEILTQIILDVLTPLSILKKPEYGFLHSDLKTKNILVKNNRFYVADFDKSSLFYHKIRFYNGSYDYKVEKWMGLKFPLETHMNQYLYYTLSSSWLPLHPYIMSNPYGFYLSFDIYTFFYSLALEPKVYQYLSSNPNSFIWTLYEYLFHVDEPQEWIKFTRSLFDLHTTNSISQSIKFFWTQFIEKQYKLHYDVSAVYKWMGLTPPPLMNTTSPTIQLVSKGDQLFVDQ